MFKKKTKKIYKGWTELKWSKTHPLTQTGLVNTLRISTPLTIISLLLKSFQKLPELSKPNTDLTTSISQFISHFLDYYLSLSLGFCENMKTNNNEKVIALSSSSLACLSTNYNNNNKTLLSFSLGRLSVIHPRMILRITRKRKDLCNQTKHPQSHKKT